MNQRTIVRSLTTQDGTLVAMNDGMIVWKPHEGRPTRTTIDDLPTVLLALKGPMGPVDAVALGTAKGDVHVFTLPRMETIGRFNLESGSIRALHLVAEGSMHFVAGTQHGAVWSLRDDQQERCQLLFSIDGPVSSLHIDGETVHVRSGWYHHERTWDGQHHQVNNTADTFQVKRFKRLDRSYLQPHAA
jgi:hypothetical protein